MTKQAPSTPTPMMKQWHSCKKMAGDALLLFRMGDFYEAFYDDAVIIAKELELTLTKRQGIPMCGIPQHTVENYLDKLVSQGFRVAVAEQLEDPKQVKGLVKREVVRVVTPGTLTSSALLAEKSNNFIAAIGKFGEKWGLSFLDLTTAEFQAIEFPDELSLLNELYRIHPAEIVTSDQFEDTHPQLVETLRQNHKLLMSTQESWHFDHQTAYDNLLQLLSVLSLDGFGLAGMEAAVSCAGGLITYLQDSLCLSIKHITHISTYTTSEYLSLDRITQRNLELTESLADGSKTNTLLDVLDQTSTPMGGRLLRHWIKQPLLDVELINLRQESIETLLLNRDLSSKLSELLGQIRDLERLTMKVSTKSASPRDLVSLRTSLEHLPEIKNCLSTIDTPLLQKEASNIEDLSSVVEIIARALVDEPAIRIGDGRSLRNGYHAEVDELRALSKNSKDWIARYQAELKEKLDIRTLKVGFNRVFGYYIEVSKGQADRMPDTFQRRQTLVNGERYISPELKEFEHKILTSEERISTIEVELFEALRTEVAKDSSIILSTAKALARLDCLCSLADAARAHAYTRPTVDSSSVLSVQDGRHPVIEAANIGENFIPNDTDLDQEDNRLFVITGPNMAGKSTYIRQVALLTIMAQMGSFIPAKQAHIGIVDKVFTRIGASDDLSRGQSTFMVEMTETANILNNATDRSLVILDEIGRGTSTYDGISIAWAVAEFLLTSLGKQAKTLFATHYWELTQLEKQVPGAVNYNVAVREHEESIIFLRKIVKGDTDKSYGIHVGRLAGLPKAVIERAKTILSDLEKNSNVHAIEETEEKSPTRKIFASRVKNNSNEVQLLLFEPKAQVLEEKASKPSEKEILASRLLSELEEIDPNVMTPMEALVRLSALKDSLKVKEEAK
jgi:DNA mismatch repair protein MutS